MKKIQESKERIIIKKYNNEAPREKILFKLVKLILGN